MEYSDMWWNDLMEIPLMIKHVQVIKHFEKKYNVTAQMDLTFKESKKLADAIAQMKFLKTRRSIDTDKMCSLYKLMTSPDLDNRQLGYHLLRQFISLTKQTARIRKTIGKKNINYL